MEWKLLQIHNGCDARGGYTDAKLFQVGEPYLPQEYAIGTFTFLGKDFDCEVEEGNIRVLDTGEEFDFEAIKNEILNLNNIGKECDKLSYIVTTESEKEKLEALESAILSIKTVEDLEKIKDKVFKFTETIFTDLKDMFFEKNNVHQQMSF